TLCHDICFFFQAEDGIRDFHVTGVQTCALPICERRHWLELAKTNAEYALAGRLASRVTLDERFGELQEVLGLDEIPNRIECFDRSEERRVGKERRARGAGTTARREDRTHGEMPK